MLELYPYDAGKGDCLRIRFPGESGTYHNILVDSGTPRFGKAFAAICGGIVSAGEAIDMVIITHVDEDHLGGLLYMVKNQIPLKSGTVMMNHPLAVPAIDGNADTPLSLAQNDMIFRALSAQGVNVKGALRGEVIALDGARLHILNPTMPKLEALFGTAEANVPLGIRDNRPVALEVLMEQKLPCGDASRNNRASIVFVLEYAEKRLLFTGDAGAGDILDGLSLYMETQQTEKPVRFDAVKLPHHGSAGNISETWPDVLQSQRYIICADGKPHPDKLTIAKLLKWYGDVEVISARDWWEDGYFSQRDVEQFIVPKRLSLRHMKGDAITWQT